MARTRGNVNALGQPTDGTTGYSVAPHVGSQTGAWTITYDQPFDEIPTLLVSLINAEWNMTFRTRPRATGCDIETYRNDGTPSAASFNFLAQGPR